METPNHGLGAEPEDVKTLGRLPKKKERFLDRPGSTSAPDPGTYSDGSYNKGKYGE